MKLITQTSSLAVVAAMLSAPAFAGGLSEPYIPPAPTAPVMTAPVVMAPAGWGGFYLGGQVGMADAELSSDDADFDPAFDELGGNFYGLHAGYMADIGAFVLGGEIDYDKITFDEYTLLGADVPGEDTDGTAMRLKLRAGYNLGNFLPYATAGLVRLELDDAPDSDGSFFGGGVAFKATDRILVGGEVLKHKFEDAFDTEGLDLDATTFSVRASYRF